MPVYVSNTTLTGGTSLVVTDASGNKTYQQNSAGQVLLPRTSANTSLNPLFNVGLGSNGAWVTLSGAVIFSYTGGSGYTNIGNCYNITNGRFTAPWTGLYLFKHHIYCYGNNSTYTWYFQPLYTVNGSSSLRRPGGPPIRIRQYGLYASYGQDTDCCELTYLTAGDYVNVSLTANGTMQGLDSYSSFSGAYLGS